MNIRGRAPYIFRAGFLVKILYAYFPCWFFNTLYKLYRRRCLFCYLTQKATHPYEKIGSGEGRYPYEKNRAFVDLCDFPYENIGLLYRWRPYVSYTREQNRNCHIDT